MNLIYLYLGCNVSDSQCDDDLDCPGSGHAPCEEPAHVATGLDIGTY